MHPAPARHRGWHPAVTAVALLTAATAAGAAALAGVGPAGPARWLVLGAAAGFATSGST